MCEEAGRGTVIPLLVNLVTVSMRDEATEKCLRSTGGGGPPCSVLSSTMPLVLLSRGAAGPVLVANLPALCTAGASLEVNLCRQSGATEWLAVTGLGVTGKCASVVAADMLDTHTELTATLV